MKTTIDLPDELVREVKVRAAREGRRMKDVMAEVIRRGLGEPSGGRRRGPARVRLPLVRCVHPATPDQEVTPERAARLLLADEARSVGAPDVPLR